jgi:hypothetical protein
MSDATKRAANLINSLLSHSEDSNILSSTFHASWQQYQQFGDHRLTLRQVCTGALRYLPTPHHY